MIIFKRKKFRIEFESLDIRLIHIAFALAGLVKYEFGKDLTITSVKRNDPNSTHGHQRALDFRISQRMGKYFTDEEVEVMKVFCSYYKYGHNRPTLYVHKNRLAGGYHGHLQVNSADTLILSKHNA